MLSYQYNIILFVLGLSLGSFINVVSLRYQPEIFLFSFKTIKGRSKCPSCGKTLKWHELIPLVSFFIQRGKCRECRARLTFQYPLVEFFCGLVFVGVPYFLAKSSFVKQLYFSGKPIDWYIWFSVIWIAVFLFLILLSVIDLRQKLIPNEANAILAVLGVVLILVKDYYGKFSLTEGSFLKNYALIFGLRDNIWINHLAAFLAAAGFFLLIILISRGQGMGAGDLKLAGALGIVFGWPDIILIIMLAFILGTLFSVGMMVLKKKKLKDMVSFGPFLAVAAVLVFFWGYNIMDFYFGLF